MNCHTRHSIDYRTLPHGVSRQPYFHGVSYIMTADWDRAPLMETPVTMRYSHSFCYLDRVSYFECFTTTS